MMENNIDLEEIPEGLPKARIKLKKDIMPDNEIDLSDISEDEKIEMLNKDIEENIEMFKEKKRKFCYE